MHVLIVYAHHDHGSFSKAMKDTAVKTLEDCGHTIEVSDLYAMHFNPVANVTDNRGERASTSGFKYLTEMAKAAKEGTVATDIQTELDKINRANLVIFQFPMYWFSLPAILKGWMDRVLPAGTFTAGGLYDAAKLTDKRAMLSFTTGAPESFYTNTGVNGDMEIMLWPIQYGTLSFVGFKVLRPEMQNGIAHFPEDARKGCLSKWAERLRNIEKESPLSFINIQNFTMDPKDPNFGLLSETYLKSDAAKMDTAPTLGQHMGKVQANGTKL